MSINWAAGLLDLKSAASNELINWADFLSADSDAIIFGQTDIFDF